MATLEKIRSKSVFLIIVIGVALLAFIVGDALTNSQNIFGDRTTVAKIGGVKIDYTEYQRKREQLNEQLEQARRQNPQQYANFDTQLLPQMALDQLISEALVKNAADKAGIRSSSNLLRYYMLDNPQSQEVMNIVRQLNASGLSVQTPQQAYEIIFNPKRNGLTDAQVEPFQRAWIAAEREMEGQISAMVYQRLLAGTVRANDLDKKMLYDNYINTSNVELAYLPFGELSEKEYPVTEAEVKAAYDKEKNLFKVEEATKEISFIAVNVAPSAEDKAAAQKLAEATAHSLAANAGPLDKNLKKEGVDMQRHSLRASDLPAGPVKDYLLAATPDSVKLISSNARGFQVIRMGARTSEIDSIQVNVVSAATEDLGLRVMARLNGGLPVDSITSTFSVDSVVPQLDQWITLYTADGPTNALPDATLDSLRNAGGKFISLQAGPQGMVMAQLVKQNAPVTIYEYDEATFELGPSSKTLSAEREKLEKFLAANTDSKKFAENAAKAGYNLQNFTVTASTPAIPRFQGFNQYYPESRQVMRWVMIDGKEGEVSHIYEYKDHTAPALYVAAVDSEYDDFCPVTNKEVKSMLERKVRAEKAGDKLLAKYSKNVQSIAAAAQAMKVAPTNLPAFRFSSQSGVNDPEVTGIIAGAKADKKVNIVKGQDGIYVYQVMGRSTEKFPYNDSQYEQQYYRLVNPDIDGMLRGTSKFKNNIYKFEAGE